jgi:hypothetical protein
MLDDWTHDDEERLQQLRAEIAAGLPQGLSEEEVEDETGGQVRETSERLADEGDGWADRFQRHAISELLLPLIQRLTDDTSTSDDDLDEDDSP